MKNIAGLFGGLFLAVLGAMLATNVFSNFPDKAGYWVEIVFFALWLAGIAVALSAPTVAKAWRYLLLSAAVLAFLIPVVSFLASNILGAEEKYAAAKAAGIAMGPGSMDVIGVFFGVVFLVIGLLVGRDKPVKYDIKEPLAR
jgi:hypothetical protein